VAGAARGSTEPPDEGAPVLSAVSLVRDLGLPEQPS
jgi:hypothetical protein